MDLYCKEIRKWETNFYDIEYIHVVRDKNQAADALWKLGSSRAQIPRGIFIQDIHEPSVGSTLVEKQPTEAMLIDDAPRQPVVVIGVHRSSSIYRTGHVGV